MNLAIRGSKRNPYGAGTVLNLGCISVDVLDGILYYSFANIVVNWVNGTGSLLFLTTASESTFDSKILKYI